MLDEQNLTDEQRAALFQSRSSGACFHGVGFDRRCSSCIADAAGESVVGDVPGQSTKALAEAAQFLRSGAP